jgi:hypothetical protein
MSDDDLMEKLRTSVTTPPEADDPAFWVAFEGDLQRRLAARPRRRWPAVLAMTMAAAAALIFFLRPVPVVPAVHEPAATVEEELLPSEDPTELVGDLDLEQLQAVEDHFHGGV